jgi:hypothetical protein
MTKKTIQDVVDIINTEGLGYAVQDYLNFDNIEDKELLKLWMVAQETLDAIEKYIESRMPEDFEWD